MQIIIPMSGFGERFRRAGYSVPKPLIEIAGRPIISYVAELFPDEDDILFICNHDHLENPAFGMRDALQAIRPRARIIGIAPHHKGPVYAVTRAFDAIRNDAPTIVNYCDFACYWDYAHFRRFVAESGCDGAIPAYRGFHPHCLGSTFYAYLRERNGWVFDIQEKRPFTDDPSKEYASSGTYYFSTGTLMKQAFEETLRRNLEVNGEHYVSLAYKPLFDAGKRVAVYDLQHFMQWGTPEDLAAYRQYEQAFRRLALPERHYPASHSGALIVPMAGAGARFVAAGYAEPKPLIPVSSRPMAVAAIDDLPRTDVRVFILRRDLPQVAEIENALRTAYPDCRIVMLDALTEGQAITCLAGLGETEAQAPVTIGACDTGALYDSEKFNALMQDPAVDVIVWGFRGHEEATRRPASYGWIDADGGIVRAVSVKTPLKDPAHNLIVIGTFTFRRAANFEKVVERMIDRGARVNNEYYVDTCINDAIALGLNVRLFEVDAYLCWGTPNELKTFNYWQSCFHKWSAHPYSLSRDARVPLDRVDALERRYAAVRPALPAERG